MIPRVIIVVLIVVGSCALLVLPRNQFKNFLQNSEATQVSEKSQEIFPKPKPTYKEAPQITARAAVVLDAKSGISLFEKNPNLKHLPASTTKMMTALVTLENCLPQDVITTTYVEKDGTQMGLVTGDKVTVENLLWGLLLNSGNDAAHTLAQNCAQSYDGFISEMNTKAKDLDMKNTHFVNPTGFDNNYQYSTALDLAKLARVIVANPLIAKIVATKSTVVTDITGNRTYFLENVNKLLGVVEGVEGVKTGQTEGALEIVVTKTTRENNTIIISILGSQDRFAETKNLIDWAYLNHEWL